jgi:hypothetical protein
MNQHTDSAKPSTLSTPQCEDAGKPASLKIVTIGSREGVFVKGKGPTATIAVVPAELAWIGRDASGEITEIMWDRDAALFVPKDFERLRSKEPFEEFTILIRNGGPSTVVSNANALFVGEKALIIREGDGAIVTVPISAIKAVEIPCGLQPAVEES